MLGAHKISLMSSHNCQLSATKNHMLEAQHLTAELFSSAVESNVTISPFQADLIADIDRLWLRNLFTYVYFRLVPDTGCRWDGSNCICTCCRRVHCDCWEDMCGGFCFRSCDSSFGKFTSKEDDCGVLCKPAGSIRGRHGDGGKGDLEMRLKFLYSYVTRRRE